MEIVLNLLLELGLSLGDLLNIGVEIGAGAGL